MTELIMCAMGAPALLAVTIWHTFPNINTLKKMLFVFAAIAAYAMVGTVVYSVIP